MERLEYSCPFDLANTMINTIGKMKNEVYPVIAVYGHYDIIRDVLQDLVMSGVDIGNIDLEDYDVSHYNKEFALYLTEDSVSVDRLWDKDEEMYLGSYGDICMVHEDCSSALLKRIDSKSIYEFGIVVDDECDCDEPCECACKDDSTDVGKIAKESYMVNGKPATKEEFQKVEEEFNKEFKESLLNWCEIMDEMNNWRRLFNW